MITKKQAQQISYNHISSVKENWRLLSINSCEGGWKFTWCGKKLPEHQFVNFVVNGKLYHKYERSFLGYEIPVQASMVDMLLYVWQAGDVGMEETLAEMQVALWKKLPLTRQQNRLYKVYKKLIPSVGLTVFNELYSAQRTKPNEQGIVEFSGFTSTSKSPMWNTFAKKGGAVYTLNKVIGYDLSEYNSGEQEVILLPGTKWKVVAESTATIQKGDYEYSWEFEVPHYVVEPLIPRQCEQALKIPYSLEEGYLEVIKELPEHGWKIAWELPLVHCYNEWIVTENYPEHGWMVAERL